MSNPASASEPRAPAAISDLRARLRAEAAHWNVPGWRDPRWPFAFLLTLYCVLGFLFFGFNRTPWQMGFILVSGAVLDVVLALVVDRRRVFPLSAWISCASLAILLNYSKHSAVLFLPVLLAIGSKYVLTFQKRHVLNPSMFGVAVSLLVGHEVITASPAYQWAGSSLTVSFFLLTAALMLFVWRIHKGWLIGSFLVFYALNTAVRAWVMRHHLPPEMLFLGTMTTPPFYLFTMYMITDPQTSPKTPGMQVVIAFCIAAVDLVLHLKESVYTFFYAALIVGSVRYLVVHGRALWQAGPHAYFRDELGPRRRRAVAAVGGIALAYAGVAWALDAHRPAVNPGFTMTAQTAADTGLLAPMSTVLNDVDPRVAHVAKWILSVGDAVAAADVDGDGDVDLFLTNTLKEADSRAALYLNVTAAGAPLRFTRFPLPDLTARAHDPKHNGLPAAATFADVDGDSDLDLTVAYAFGPLLQLKNMLSETGTFALVDNTAAAGLGQHNVSLGITFLDWDNDHDLDMLVLDALAPQLPDYTPKQPLNIFDLPQPTSADDRRALHFMHDGWHDANNGGGQTLYENDGSGAFRRKDGATIGLTSTRWSLAVSVLDMNQDGFMDLYVANDFGPDDVYLNDGGKRFIPVRGEMFNSIGHDTYKGMNSTAVDVDGDGMLDVYISNVHHALQAEGSMLWMIKKNPTRAFLPSFSDEATQRGALNEHRFGWGAAAGDLNNDGYPDLVQANGMVDDRLDKLLPDGARKDYWYVNHKLMQSGPDIHTYADMWGDIRGRTLYPNEARRALLNLGGIRASEAGTFVDVADALGIAAPNNSRGVLLADFDNDGDLDAVITNQHDQVSVYQSTLRQDRAAHSHYVNVALHGAGANTHGVGARVTVTTTDAAGIVRSQMQQLDVLAGFSAMHPETLHFGVGHTTGSVDVDVVFPGGARAHASTPVDRTVTVQEPAP